MENKRIPRTHYLHRRNERSTFHAHFIGESEKKRQKKKKKRKKREEKGKNRGKKEWKKKKIERVYITADKRTRVRGWNRHGSN